MLPGCGCADAVLAVDELIDCSGTHLAVALACGLRQRRVLRPANYAVSAIMKTFVSSVPNQLLHERVAWGGAIGMGIA
jgi:hypothetical protein